MKMEKIYELMRRMGPEGEAISTMLLFKHKAAAEKMERECTADSIYEDGYERYFIKERYMDASIWTPK